MTPRPESVDVRLRRLEAIAVGLCQFLGIEPEVLDDREKSSLDAIEAVVTRSADPSRQLPGI